MSMVVGMDGSSHPCCSSVSDSESLTFSGVRVGEVSFIRVHNALVVALLGNYLLAF